MKNEWDDDNKLNLRKQAEDALRESEERFRNLFETMVHGVVYQDSKGNIIDANPSSQRILGLSLDQMQGRKSIDPRWKSIHEDGSDFPGEEHPAMLALKTGKDVNNVIMGVYNPSVEEFRWIKVNAIPQFSPGEDKPHQAYTTFEDITERKQVEETLRESEGKYRALFEEEKNAIFVYDPETMLILDANPAMSSTYGYSYEELIGMNCLELSAEVEESLKAVASADKDGRFKVDLRWHKKKNGVVFPLELAAYSTVLNEKTVGFIVINDITERMRAEEALRKQQYFFQKAQEMGHFGSWELDIKKNELLWTDENYRIFGIPIGTQLTYETFLNCIHPEDREFVETEWKASFNKKPYDIEHRLLVDGKVKWVREKAELFFNEKDECIRGTGFTQDISESKRAEQDLLKERTLLKAIIDKIPVMLTHYNPNANILYLNKEFEKTIGWKTEEIQDIDLMEKVYPDPDYRQQAVEYMLKASTGWREFRVQSKSGEIIDSEWSNICMEDGTQIGIGIDITEQKQAENELKFSAERFERWKASNFIGILQSKAKGGVIEANDTLLSMIGYSRQDLLEGTLDWTNLTPPEFLHLDKKAMEEAADKGFWTPFEKEYFHKNGHRIPIIIGGSVFKEYPDDYIVFIIDITARKQAEEEKANLEAQLQQAQKIETVGTMAGGIAHDFNNLLTIIQGNIDMAEEDAATGSPQAKALNAAIRAVQQAASLTNKFITFSSGGSPVKNALIPQEFIKDTVNIALSGSNIQCDFSIDQDLGMVEIDQDQMSQAIGNIITNAKEAMPRGGTIHLTARNMSNEQITHETGLKLQSDFFVKITVEDQGEGISKEDLNKIFDPYFSSKDRGTQKGMGLGLTIANSIIHKHGGHIQVESEEGKGATASIYLPVVQQNEAVVYQFTDKVVDSPPNEREKKTTKILIMDDEGMISDMAKRMLGALGYEQVEVAPHGEDALKMYTQARDHGEPFDLLLLDLTIKGGMGGEETIERLYEINPEVRAIVCSGYSKDPVVANYAAYGFIGVLAKPFSRNELDNAITQALDKK